MFGSIWPMASYDFDLLFSSTSCRPSNSKKEAKTYGRGWWRRRANSKLPVNMEFAGGGDALQMPVYIDGTCHHGRTRLKSVLESWPQHIYLLIKSRP
jgi:hypothetical protein